MPEPAVGAHSQCPGFQTASCLQGVRPEKQREEEERERIERKGREKDKRERGRTGRRE